MPVGQTRQALYVRTGSNDTILCEEMPFEGRALHQQIFFKKTFNTTVQTQPNEDVPIMHINFPNLNLQKFTANLILLGT
jgi:hypothetical protein